MPLFFYLINADICEIFIIVSGKKHNKIVIIAHKYSIIFEVNCCLFIDISVFVFVKSCLIIFRYANIEITLVIIPNRSITTQIRFALEIPENKYNFARKPLVGGNPASDSKQIISAIEK